MSSQAVLVEQSQQVAAPAERVWSLLSRPEAMVLRPRSFAFDVGSPPATTLRMVVSVALVSPIWVAYAVREEVPGQVLSLSVPGRSPGEEEVLTLSVVPEGADSRVAMQARQEGLNREGQAVVADYWQQTLPLWLAGIREVAEGRAPLPDGKMPAELQAACTPPALAGRLASASASALIAAPGDVVWEAIYEPESSATLMSSGGPVDAGVVPGTPQGQAGEVQYFIARHDNGTVLPVLRMVRDIAAGSFALFCVLGTQGTLVGKPGLEMLHQVAPDGPRTRLVVTFRWPSNVPNGRSVGKSMARTAQARASALKNLIENRSRPVGGRP
jgi:uncharacterized protein YndB with AHSA1/START domain